MIPAGWQIEVHRGSASEFHAREVPATLVPSVWWFDVQSAALALGSSQPLQHVDIEGCARRGVEIIRRRSGGGAVLLEPGDVIWADVLLPSTDRRWTADISRSAWWLGEVWQDALASLGVADTTVHRARMERSAWSDRLCFAGIGGGEVMRLGRKVVGISQRRTRAGARFQCAMYRHWRPDAHVPLFAQPGPQPADLADLAVEIDAEPAVVMAAFSAALRRA